MTGPVSLITDREIFVGDVSYKVLSRIMRSRWVRRAFVLGEYKFSMLLCDDRILYHPGIHRD